MASSKGKPSIYEQLVGIIKNMSGKKQAKLLEVLKQWNEKGNREFTRKECLIPVDFSSQDRFFRDFIQNISAGGLFIETREAFQEGQEIGLTFSIPNSEIPFRISGKITRTSQDGIAVQFSKVTSYQEEILNSLIEKM